jgi:hypothetical protein
VMCVATGGDEDVLCVVEEETLDVGDGSII